MCDYFDSRETVGTLLHIRWRIEGMTTITRCRMLSDSVAKQKLKKMNFFHFFCPEHPL